MSRSLERRKPFCKGLGVALRPRETCEHDCVAQRAADPVVDLPRNALPFAVELQRSITASSLSRAPSTARDVCRAIMAMSLMSAAEWLSSASVLGRRR